MSGWIRWGVPAAASALFVPIVVAGRLLFASGGGAGESNAIIGADVSGASANAAPLGPLVTAAERTAPFRLDGRPSRVAYDPTRSEAAATGYDAPKPALVLTGLVGGDRPLVLIEGIPGRDGPALLGVGDTLAGLKVRRIREGKVTITGMDTTWVLTVRGLR